MENQPRRFFRDLVKREAKVRAAFYNAVDIISDAPFPGDHPPATIKHLKGTFLCHHEYRNLPNEQRIFYKTVSRDDVDKEKAKQNEAFPWDNDDQVGLLIIFYAGPHP